MKRVTVFKMDSVVAKKQKKTEHQLELLQSDSGNYGHGGARVGSGRKRKEKTVTIRVPESLVPRVRQMIDNHKAINCEKD